MKRKVLLSFLSILQAKSKFHMVLLGFEPLIFAVLLFNRVGISRAASK